MSKHTQTSQDVLRNTALQLAVTTRKDIPATPKQIVKAAEIYYDFLADEDDEWEEDE